MPTTVLFASASKHSRHVVSFALTATTAGLSVVAFLCAATIPHAPPRHFRSAYTYSVQSDLGDHHRANVSKNVEASVLSLTLFNWVTPVLKTGYSKEQMGLDDLPHLSASFRTITLFRNFRNSARQSVQKHRAKMQARATINEEAPRDGLGYAPGWFNRLLWRLIVINKVAFSLQCLLAVITAFLYYLPAFFLQKVVAFLERTSEGQDKDRILGYAYCLGLLLALVLDAISTQQLWYISNCMLASRARVQLNSIIFAKTLKVGRIALNANPGSPREICHD